MTKRKRSPVIPDLSNTERLWARILPNIRVLPNGCWEWTGQLQHDGYGLITVKTTEGKFQPAKIHRVIYALTYGECPPTKQLHHECHRDQRCPLTKGCPHRRCANPEHVEPTTAVEHGMEHRSERCKTDLHSLSGENLYLDPSGKRICRACRSARTSAWQRVNRAKRNAQAREQRQRRAPSPEQRAATVERVRQWRLKNPDARKQEWQRAKARKAAS